MDQNQIAYAFHGKRLASVRTGNCFRSQEKPKSDKLKPRSMKRRKNGLKRVFICDWEETKVSLLCDQKFLTSLMYSRTRLSIFLFFLSFCFFRSATALPMLCSDPKPIDLLAKAISSGGAGLAGGVEVASDANDIKGYRFDHSARLIGVQSDQIFPFCNHFPVEFSLLVTFQQQPQSHGNQYIMALLAQDKQTILLGLRLQQERLALDYWSSVEGEKRSVFIKDSLFADGKWHTVAVVATTKFVRFTVDCGPAQKRKLGSDFPKRLNVKRTKIYVASKRKKRKRFKGLLRQLILLPGADVTRQICPSENPSLADLNEKSQGDRTPAKPSVIFEEDLKENFCSSQTRGTLMYTRDMAMKICNGRSFKPVHSGPERLDYVIDYEDLITDNFTLSLEPFTIPGEGLFIAAASNDDSKTNFSQIFKWNGKRFIRYQNLTTDSAIMWKFFQIEYQYFLVVANNGKNSETFSIIYRWSSKRKKFQRFQKLKTYKVRSIEFFHVSGQYFLFIANQQQQSDSIFSPSENEPSKIYRWMEDKSIFSFYQSFPSEGAFDVTFFEISLNPALTYSCFVIANAFDGQISRAESKIYCWNGSEFELRQMIMTVGAADWEFFHFEDRYFLAVANSFENFPNTKTKRHLNSSIYELNVQYAQFLLYQNIETYGANDWEFFSIGTQYFLIAANTVSSVSELYRWQGIEKFVKIHSLPVGPCSDFDHVLIDGEHYLAYANPKGNFSKLYKLVTY